MGIREIKGKKIILILLIALVYFGNYHICQYFYPGSSPEQIDKWWDLKHANYNIVIVLCIYLASLKDSVNKTINNIEILLMSVVSSIIISNIIDRLYFDSVRYEWNDIVIVVGVIAVSLFEYKRRWQKK